MGPAGPPFHRQQLQPGAQPQGFQADAARSSPQIPEHPLAGQVKVRQQLDSHLAFGHQTGMVGVLQKQTVLQAEQRQQLRLRRWGWLRDQQHREQRCQVLRQGVSAGERQHSLAAVAQVFAEPDPVARLQSTAAENAPHRFSPALLRVGEHRQGRGSLLQERGQHIGIPAMQAHPAGVLPGAADAGKRQLQGGGGRMEAQPFTPQACTEAAADAEPERIATGQHHHAGRGGQGRQPGGQSAGVVAADQSGGIAAQPFAQGRLQALRGCQVLRGPDQRLLRCGQ